MTLRQFWRLVDGSYTTLPAGNSLTQTFTHSWGISKTVSDSISASLGVGGGGLSASLSETFSQSVTTDDNTSQQVSRVINPPADGMVRVWMAWQLVHEVVALDPAGKVVGAGDRGRDNRKAAPRAPLFSPLRGAGMAPHESDHPRPRPHLLAAAASGCSATPPAWSSRSPARASSLRSRPDSSPPRPRSRGWPGTISPPRWCRLLEGTHRQLYRRSRLGQHAPPLAPHHAEPSRAPVAKRSTGCPASFPFSSHRVHATT